MPFRRSGCRVPVGIRHSDARNAESRLGIRRSGARNAAPSVEECRSGIWNALALVRRCRFGAVNVMATCVFQLVTAGTIVFDALRLAQIKHLGWASIQTLPVRRGSHTVRKSSARRGCSRMVNWGECPRIISRSRAVSIRPPFSAVYCKSAFNRTLSSLPRFGPRTRKRRRLEHRT